MDYATQQPWQWPEQHWRGLVNQVRAGRRLRPSSWKDGARCAIALSFDCDHETNELRDGGKSIGRMSWGQYGSLVGVPRILDMLRRHDVRATFFVPGVTASLYPDEQRRIAADGHEIGMHGWIHEIASTLPAETERDLMLRAADVIEAATGVRPVGLRAPSFDVSFNTLHIAREMGIRHDSSLMAHEDCYEVLLDGQPSGIVELPADWVRDDGAYLWTERFGSLRPYTHPSHVLDIFRREFDAAFDEGGLFQLVMHPHVIGYRSRIGVLDEIIRHIRARRTVWFATHAEITNWAREFAGHPTPWQGQPASMG